MGLNPSEEAPMTKSTASSTPNRNPADPNRLAQNLSKIIEQSQRVLQEYLKQPGTRRSNFLH
jgi:hypothetical protein